MRDSVLLYRSQVDALRGLPPDQFKAAMLAITDYAMDEIEPDADPVTMAVFALTKPLIDKNNKRYENGVSGGRPKNQTETKQEPNHNLKEKGERRKEKDIIDSPNKLDELTRRRVVEAWNTLTPLGITPIKAIAEHTKRYDMLKARLNQYNEQQIVDCIASVNEQQFLHGQSWFTFDWFIKPNNFVKVYEGNYKTAINKGKKNAFTGFQEQRDNRYKIAELEKAEQERMKGPAEDWSALKKALLGG